MGHKAPLARRLVEAPRGGGDADYGDTSNFLAGLEARQDPYVVAVRTGFEAAALAGVSREEFLRRLRPYHPPL